MSIRITEKKVENVIMLEKTYYTMKDNKFIATRKLKQTTATIKIIEVENYHKLSAILEAQNNQDDIESVVFEQQILKEISN